MWGYPGVREVHRSEPFGAELSQAVICRRTGEVIAVLSVQSPEEENPGPPGVFPRNDVIVTSLVESATAGATRPAAEERQSSAASRNRIHRFFLLHRIRYHYFTTNNIDVP